MWNSLLINVISTHNTKLFNEHLLDTYLYTNFCMTGLKGDLFRPCLDNAVYCLALLIFVNKSK